MATTKGPGVAHALGPIHVGLDRSFLQWTQEEQDTHCTAAPREMAHFGAFSVREVGGPPIETRIVMHHVAT